MNSKCDHTFSLTYIADCQTGSKTTHNYTTEKHAKLWDVRATIN